MADEARSAAVVGLDPQAGFPEQARAAARTNQDFVPGAAPCLVEALAGDAFDVVSSRSALPWGPLDQHPAVLAGVRHELRPDPSVTGLDGVLGNDRTDLGSRYRGSWAVPPAR